MSQKCLSNRWLYQDEIKHSWGIYSSQVASILSLQALRKSTLKKKKKKKDNPPKPANAMLLQWFLALVFVGGFGAGFFGFFFGGGRCSLVYCICRKSTGWARVDERMCFLLKAVSVCVSLTGPKKHVNHTCLLKRCLWKHSENWDESRVGFFPSS